MNRTKRIIALVSALGIMSASLVGCGGEGSKTSDKSDKKDAAKGDKSITLMIPDWGAPSDELLDEFTAKSGVEVEVDVVSWDDIRDKVSIAAAGKKAAADVFEVDWSWTGEFNSAGWIEPIPLTDEEIDAMPSIQSFMVDGQILALPYSNDYRIAYYNTEDFKKANISEAPKTWDEVYEDAKKIKADGIKEYPLTIPMSAEESSTTALIWLTFAKHGKVFNEDNTLDKDAVLDSLKFIDKINKEGLVNPANRTASGGDTYRQLPSGEASFMVGPTSYVGSVNNPEESQVVDKVMPILVPGQTEPAKQTFALPEGVGVSKYSENKEAAIEFVKWFNSPEVQEKLYEEKSLIPTRTSVIEKLIDEGKIKNAGAMLEESKLIKSPFPHGVPNYYSEMSKTIFDAVNKMAIEQATPEEAFDIMDAKVKELAKK